VKSIIPDAALAQHVAVLGKTGSGKTFAVKGIIEQLLHDKRRVGIVDPTGAWWGLRSSRDGKAPGFPILVLGGDHGDLPLPALGGAAVARLLADQGVNLVADTSLLTVGERTRWFIDFASTLYRTNRAPLHLVLDEAHNFAPQGKVPDPDTGKMLHAANTLASGGRSRGIRLVLITQRPQKLHKDALTSADTLIAMRVLAPHDREAVRAWVVGCGDERVGKEVLDSLASLKRGEGWIWYPEGKFLERVTFPPITTFDSSATPTDGGTVRAPKSAAEIDLTEIRTSLADAVKEAEANDPKLLRQRIATLERDVRDAKKLAAAIPVKHVKATAAVPVPVLKPGDVAKVERFLERAHAEIERQEQIASKLVDALILRLREVGTPLASAAEALHQALKSARGIERSTSAPIGSQTIGSAPGRVLVKRELTPGLPMAPVSTSNGHGKPSRGSGAGRMLAVLARAGRPLSREELGVWALVHPGGGSFDTYVGRLTGAGHAERGQHGYSATTAGVAAADPALFLPLDSLVPAWFAKIGAGNGAGRMLHVRLHAAGAEIPREDLGNAAQVSPTGGSFDTYIGRLTGPGLVERVAGGFRVARTLLEDLQ